MDNNNNYFTIIGMVTNRGGRMSQSGHRVLYWITDAFG